MKLAIIALSTAALIASPAAFAQGVSGKTPGHQMQKATKSRAGRFRICARSQDAER